jgi:DNA mismatch endonuclease (patch repair protein)
MQRTGQKNTPAEITVRSALHKLGLRYRLHKRPLPGIRRTADIVFFRAKVSVFVDGCFWHGCPSHGTWPKSNAEWWKAKIEANRRRDAETNELFTQSGWAVIRVWEHEDQEEAAARIAEIVRTRLASLGKKGRSKSNSL